MLYTCSQQQLQMYIKDMKFVNICWMPLVGGFWNWVLICTLQNNGRVHYLLLVFSIDFLIEIVLETLTFLLTRFYWRS